MPIIPAMLPLVVSLTALTSLLGRRLALFVTCRPHVRKQSAVALLTRRKITKLVFEMYSLRPHPSKHIAAATTRYLWPQNHQLRDKQEAAEKEEEEEEGRSEYHFLSHLLDGATRIVLSGCKMKACTAVVTFPQVFAHAPPSPRACSKVCDPLRMGL